MAFWWNLQTQLQVSLQCNANSARVYLEGSMISCHEVSTATYCICSSEHKLTNFAACNYRPIFLFHTVVGHLTTGQIFLSSKDSAFSAQRFSPRYYYVWNHFLFSFTSPSLSHESTLCLPLLKFLSSNV